MGNVNQEKEFSIEELEGQIEGARRKIKLERQKLKALKKKQEIEKILENPEAAVSTPKWAYVSVVILILVIIGGVGYYFFKDNITGSTINVPVKTEKENPAVNTEPKTEEVVYDLGDKVKMGNLTITITEVSGVDKVGKLINNKFAGVEAEGIYYIVGLEIENNGKKSIKFDSEIYIKDDGDREYTSDERAESYYTQGKVLDLSDEVKPLLLKKGVKIFDVPKASKKLKLSIKDENTEITIDLESKGKIKITTVEEEKAAAASEPGPQIKVRLTDITDHDLPYDFIINGTDSLDYIYRLENLDKTQIRCNVDEDINGAVTKDHQILKLNAFEKEHFPENIKLADSINFTVGYTTRCHFSGKTGETINTITFGAQFVKKG